MNKSKIEEILVKSLVISGFIGPVLSMGKFYFFHFVLIIYYLLIFSNFIIFHSNTIKLIKFFSIFFIISFFSLFWSVNLIISLTYLFYFFCGFTIIFSIVNYSVDTTRIYNIFNILFFLLITNLLIGFFETFGYFRLIKSYDDYLDSLAPSGFFSNINNFAFIFSLSLPFLIFNRIFLVKAFGFIVSFWFLLFHPSKGYLLSIFLLFLFFLYRNTTNFTKFFVSLFFAVLIFIFYDFFNEKLINEILRGVLMIRTGEFDEISSTGIRSFIYIYGLNALIDSYGVGLGLGGIHASLVNLDIETTSFHYFFLEMLIDLGVIFFGVLFYLYCNIFISNINQTKYPVNHNINYLSQSSGYALFIAIFSSISPSSIIYILPFWIFLGFSISLFFICKPSSCRMN